jgi:hypothetical protein
LGFAEDGGIVHGEARGRSLRQNPEIEKAELKGELLLFNSASNKFFVMNPTASFVWDKLA